jgi:hypothetical protein
MTSSSKSEPRSFTAFSSASEEARQHDAAQVGGADSGRAGANSRPDEITTLERRVLAHERILQSLLGHLAEDDPEILVQLKARFSNAHNMGEYEQDYVSTDDYGDHFIRAIEAEVAERKRRYEASRPRTER